MHSRDALLSALDEREVRQFSLRARVTHRCSRCGNPAFRPGICVLCTVELEAARAAAEDGADF